MSLHRYIKKAWSYSDHRVEVAINNKRLGRTIIAAIGEPLNGACIKIDKSTSSESFLEFLV